MDAANYTAANRETAARFTIALPSRGATAWMVEALVRRTDSTFEPPPWMQPPAGRMSHIICAVRSPRVSANAVIDGLCDSARAFPESVMTARRFDKSAKGGRAKRR